MTTIDAVCEFLDRLAPCRLAEDWDNVGLLVGRRDRPARRVMTCLTVTPASAAEAADKQADLVVTHHPLPFHSLKRLTPDTIPGRLLLTLIESRVAVASGHTAFDSSSRGINQRLAEGLRLADPRPLVPLEGDPEGLGWGRWGDLPQPAPLSQVAAELAKLLSVDGLFRVGGADQPIRRAAVACGSAGKFLDAAAAEGCDLLVTGEASFHTCLEAESSGIALLLPGHYASERFAVEAMAEELAAEFSDVEAWASTAETDPLVWDRTESR